MIVVAIMIVISVTVEMLTNVHNFVFEGLAHGLGVALATGHAADVRRIYAEAIGDALVEAAKKGEPGKWSCARMRVVTFHVAFLPLGSRGCPVTD